MTKKLIIFFLFVSTFSYGQTFFGFADVPVDAAGATNATTTITITPPASMLEGDLVIITMQRRTNSATTFAVTTTGGQTWNSLTQRLSGSVLAQHFWCRFNGTWDTNPIVDFGGATCTSAVMLVFRPTATTKLWNLDAETTNTFTAPTTPFTVTVTGRTPAQNNNVNLATWFTADDNTWGTLSGTNWIKTSLTAQYRNTSSTDQSMSFAYQIQSTAAATNNVSQNQATLGGDAGLWTLTTWYQSDPPSYTSPIKNRIVN